MKKKYREIKDYDETDTTPWIDRSKRVTLKALGFKLPPTPPTQVVSIRLPTPLLNRLRAEASARDIPYQSFMKLLLARSLRRSLNI